MLQGRRACRTDGGLPDLKAPTAMAGGCTFGEQGPLLSAGNCHANLMFNIALFGDPKASSASSDGFVPVGRIKSEAATSPGRRLAKRVRNHLLKPENFHGMSRLLGQFDKDGDTRITPGEFEQAMRGFKFHMTPEDRKMLISEIDTNQDGTISYADLYRWLRVRDMSSPHRTA